MALRQNSNVQSLCFSLKYHRIMTLIALICVLTYLVLNDYFGTGS